MNKEEQESIKYLRDLRYGEINDNYKDILLNYISKLQKENKELKDKLDFEERSKVFYQEQYFKIKDKIKDKIKEFEKPLLDIAEEQNLPFTYTLDGLVAMKDGVKKVLEDLLKGN